MRRDSDAPLIQTSENPAFAGFAGPKTSVSTRLTGASAPKDGLHQLPAAFAAFAERPAMAIPIMRQTARPVNDGAPFETNP